MSASSFVHEQVELAGVFAVMKCDSTCQRRNGSTLS